MWRLWGRLFGIEYALLVCNDGDWKVRRVKRRPDGQRYAYYFGFTIGRVFLLPDGKCGGARYLDKWVPLTGSFARNTASGAAE